MLKHISSAAFQFFLKVPPPISDPVILRRFPPAGIGGNWREMAGNGGKRQEMAGNGEIQI